MDGTSSEGLKLPLEENLHRDFGVGSGNWEPNLNKNKETALHRILR